MTIKATLQKTISDLIQNLYQINDVTLEIQDNKTDFEGDFTVVIFPLVKQLKKSPDVLGMELGGALTGNTDLVSGFNVVKGFLNLTLKNEFFVKELFASKAALDQIEPKSQTVMVEYSSPNTNKPLHLGHVRNNLLGFSVAAILKEAGYDVLKTQIINDRGIHICKSMLAWQESGLNETPDSTGLKGDKLVGNYYVAFDQKYKAEIKELMESGLSEAEAKKQAPSILKAQRMLLDWEKGDTKVRDLWNTMNEWVYKGFGETYDTLGVDFDQVQYESNTYLLGKDLIQLGLNQGTFTRREDGSIWVDLSQEGLDEKLLLRSDGTSVYMTQDLGTAVQRFKDNPIDKLIYTVGNEQDYHFQVLFKILGKLGYSWADQLYHLSYGMVELPEGKMKSREGTVVDADELMAEMIETAREKAQELGKLETLSEAEKEASYKAVGLGALKYFILKVDPRKKMLFNPKESIDFNGNTGPFIQYTYARIQSLLAKADYHPSDNVVDRPLNGYEKELIQVLSNYKDVVAKAAESLSPAHVANYVYELVKSYNAFYQNNPIRSGEEAQKQFRLELSYVTGMVIQRALGLLGISTVQRM